MMYDLPPVTRALLIANVVIFLLELVPSLHPFLIAYGALFVFGAAFTLLTEWSNPDTIGNLPLGEKLLAAAFHSVTLRTAGFM